MRIINYSIVLTMWVLACASGYAQETDITVKVVLLESSKEKVISEEKEALKTEVENINKRLDSGNISPSEAEELKKKAAEKRALNIENRVTIIDNKVALLKDNEIRESLKSYKFEYSDAGNLIISSKSRSSETSHVALRSPSGFMVRDGRGRSL